MSRTFNSFKRSPALFCSVIALVIIYVVYGLLLVPNNSNLGVRNGSRMRLATLAAPPSNVAILAGRYTQEELERVMISEEARRAVEPRDLMKRVKEIGLEVMNKEDPLMDNDDLVDVQHDVHEDVAKVLEVVSISGQNSTDQENLYQSEGRAVRAWPITDPHGGKLVLKGPEVEDGIIPGRPLPAACNAEPHTDYDGVAVKWGLDHPQESAADCCEACLNQARGAQEGQLRCNVWVYCPAEEGCFSPDIYEHKQFECWLKQSERPRINFKGRYPPAYREANPKCTEVVAWASGVISSA